MIADIKRALNAISGSGALLQSAKGAGKAFELLVLTSVAKELRKRGNSVEILRSDGTTVAPGQPVTYVQRGGKPGPVEPAVNGSSGPSSILFRVNGSADEWEIWNGIQFLGRSQGAHEFDISIVPKTVADALRGNATPDHPVGHGVVSIECKDVGSAAAIDEVRAFITRIYDTTILHMHGIHMSFPGAVPQIYSRPPPTVAFGAARQTFRRDNMESYNAIVRRSGFSSGTLPLMQFYWARPFPNISPGSVPLNNFVQDLCDWIEANL